MDIESNVGELIAEMESIGENINPGLKACVDRAAQIVFQEKVRAVGRTYKKPIPTREIL